MTILPRNCSDADIRKVVVEWSEHLSVGRYAEALAMHPPTPESFGFIWTPERLQDWISNGGCSRDDYDSGEHRKVSSLFARPNWEETIRRAIDVDRENLYGLDPQDYLGMVHYTDVPLDGEASDLTARFHIKKEGVDSLMLEFLDIHVM